MKMTLQMIAALSLVLPGLSARGDAPLVYCSGTESGGDGPRQYAYVVDAASFPMTEFTVGTNDLVRDHYRNALTPPGWSFSVEPRGMAHIRGLKTAHGKRSPGPCRCLTEGTVRWWTDDPARDVAEAHLGVHTVTGAKTVSQWREDYLRDFAERMDRCKG